MMKDSRAAGVEIIAVGSELLTPFRQDTDSLFLTGRLNDLGYTVRYKTVVGDDAAGLSLRIKQALRQDDLVFVVGGLGPTSDDRTRQAVARRLGRRLVFDREILRGIEDRFRKRGLVMTAPNRRQAYIVEGATVLPNANGTAPGQWIQSGAKTLVLLPGPPHELKAMFDAQVAPRLSGRRPGHLVRRTLMTTGLGESAVESLIAGLYPKTVGLNLTILASPGLVELHVTSFSRVSLQVAEARADGLVAKLRERLGDRIYSENGESLEEALGRLLRERNKTLAVAESCTGGLIGHRLTGVPGSSDYFLGGLITYSDALKSDWLGVPAALVAAHGAVSLPVARAMAVGARRRARSDFGLAVTGIAGPGGGTPEKPVGLVWTALSWRRGTAVQKNLFWGRREQIKIQSAQKAMDMLRRHLLQEEKPVRRG